MVRFGVFTLALSTLACNPSPSEIPANQEFTLAIGQTVVIAGSDLRVTFEAVPEDSRCPLDAYCVWAGNGQVRLRLRRSGLDHTALLNTNFDPRAIVIEAYRLELLDLKPQPYAAHPTPPTAYRAHLQVSPR
jgi:hypothetical protein